MTATGLTLFAAWALGTPAGRTAYDEMDSLYPLAAAVLALPLILLATVLAVMSRRRRPR